jgi:hypothetical protein
MEVKIVAKGLHFPMAHGTKSNPHLRQSLEAWIHWTLYLSSLSTKGRINRAFTESMLHQWGDMGSGFSNHEKKQQSKR